MKPRVVDGQVMVPTTVSAPGVIGDGMAPLTPEHPLYEQWVRWMERNDPTQAPK